METIKEVRSFKEFWPVYLRAHRSGASQALHLGGILLSVTLAAALVSCGMVFFLVLAVAPAQIGAAIGHKLSPRSERIVEDHPDWAALADLKMCALMLTGRLRAELARFADLPSVPSTPRLSTG
jgi:hypothetical protein